MRVRPDEPRPAAGEERFGMSVLPQALRVRRARDAPARGRHGPRGTRLERAGRLHAALPGRGTGREVGSVSRMGKTARFLVAGFDTVAMGVLASNETGGRFAGSLADYTL